MPITGRPVDGVKTSPGEVRHHAHGGMATDQRVWQFRRRRLGEIWGTIPPIDFFLLSTVVVGGAALVLLILVRLITKTMHGVK